MDYCLSGDSGAAMWHGQPDVDLDHDGRLESIGLDFDHDGIRDDALADFDGDGVVDHAVLDLDNDGTPEAYFTDDGSGTWAVAVDRGPPRGHPVDQLRALAVVQPHVQPHALGPRHQQRRHPARHRSVRMPHVPAVGLEKIFEPNGRVHRLSAGGPRQPSGGLSGPLAWP